MKACQKCEQRNPEDALYCQQCGTPFPPASASAPLEDADLWRAFIGPNQVLRFSLTRGWWRGSASDYYLEKFNAFLTGNPPRFALTWHWPAFLLDPFLWFLYRKMYLYALVYAVGPVLSAYLTGDFTVGIVWRIIAGASANYIYFWHIRDQLARIRKRQFINADERDALLRDAGGVQPYVLWLGIALYAFLISLVIAAILQGPPTDGALGTLDKGKSPAPRRMSL